MITEAITPSTLAEQTAAQTAGWRFDNSYARLPDYFRAEWKPTSVPHPRLVVFNEVLAQELGLNPAALRSDDGAQIFAGNVLPEGAQPIAQAYAGHQFGYFALLGDGRAILLGEQLTPDGRRFDIQLKGAGQTPFSRRGDGRAALGPMLREWLISEAMYALGIPTTRSLAVVLTGEPVYRETALPGAILTRVAASHIRVGTFEYIAARRQPPEALKILADYTIQRHYPLLADAENPYLSLLYAVMERQAKLISQWMAVGFIHGVMNTDNMALSGETIDYGPCAFMDVYDPTTVFSSIDTGGRYAYGNQPQMAHWNLIRFAETLIPLLHPEQKQAITLAETALETFPYTYGRYWRENMLAKLGLQPSSSTEDIVLIKNLLDWMHHRQADFTRTFRLLHPQALPEEDLYQQEDFKNWYAQWQQRLAQQAEPLQAVQARMQHANPWIIPRNHHVERALQLAVEQGNFHYLKLLHEALAHPYEERPEFATYAEPPTERMPGYKTFCGT